MSPDLEQSFLILARDFKPICIRLDCDVEPPSPMTFPTGSDVLAVELFKHVYSTIQNLGRNKTNEFLRKFCCRRKMYHVHTQKYKEEQIQFVNMLLGDGDIGGLRVFFENASEVEWMVDAKTLMKAADGKYWQAILFAAPLIKIKPLRFGASQSERWDHLHASSLLRLAKINSENFDMIQEIFIRSINENNWAVCNFLESGTCSLVKKVPRCQFLIIGVKTAVSTGRLSFYEYYLRKLFGEKIFQCEDDQYLKDFRWLSDPLDPPDVDMSLTTVLHLSIRMAFEGFRPGLLRYLLIISKKYLPHVNIIITQVLPIVITSNNYEKTSYFLAECDVDICELIDLVYDELEIEKLQDPNQFFEYMIRNPLIKIRAKIIFSACHIRHLTSSYCERDVLMQVMLSFHSLLIKYNSNKYMRNLSLQGFVDSYGAVSSECSQFVEKRIIRDLRDWGMFFSLSMVKNWFIYEQHVSTIFGSFHNSQLLDLLEQSLEGDQSVRWVTICTALRNKYLTDEENMRLKIYEEMRKLKYTFDDSILDLVPTNSTKILWLVKMIMKPLSCGEYEELIIKGRVVCPLCLELMHKPYLGEEIIVTLKCSDLHVYHLRCVGKHFATSKVKSCPECRFDFSNQ